MNSIKLKEYTDFICIDGIESELQNISFIPESLEQLVGYINSQYGTLLKALTFVYSKGDIERINVYYQRYFYIITNELDTRDFCTEEEETGSNIVETEDSAYSGDDESDTEES